MAGISGIYFRQNTTNTVNPKLADKDMPINKPVEQSSLKTVKPMKIQLTPEQKRERNLELLKLAGGVALFAWACYHLSKIKLSPEEEFILYDTLIE